MGILDANGAIACAECGRQARAVRDRLKAENAKLRELFAEVWPIAEYAGYDHELRRARELMRELGIEVGE